MSSAISTAKRQFFSRFEAAQILGRSPVTVMRMEQSEGLDVVRIKGHVLYTVESVNAVVARWKTKTERLAANRQAVIPVGWKLWIVNARGPFIGEFIPEAPVLSRDLKRSPDLQQFPELYRWRRCIVSYSLVAEALRVADEEKLNVISNGRGIVAVKEGV